MKKASSETGLWRLPESDSHFFGSKTISRASRLPIMSL
jgi:hypothetical protein